MRSPASAIGKKRAGDLKRERVFFRFISKRPPTTSTSSPPLFFSLKKTTWQPEERVREQRRYLTIYISTEMNEAVKEP